MAAKEQTAKEMNQYFRTYHLSLLKQIMYVSKWGDYLIAT